MLKEIVNLYGIVIGEILVIAALYKLNNKKNNFKDINFYICVSIYIVFQIILNMDLFLTVKPFLSFFCLILICWQIFKKDIIQAIILTIFIYFIMLISDILIIIIVASIGRITTSSSLSNIIILINSNIYISLLINLCFAITLYLICSVKKIINLYLYINQFLYQRKIIKLYPLLTSILLFIVFSFGVICFNNDLVSKISIYFFLFLLTIYVIISNLKISTEYESTKEKYASTAKSLIEYEEMIDKYRINNHENKNQLQMIRNMIKQKDKSVEKYIDNLLDTVYTANEALMMDVSIIPAGGLRATVYAKLVTMDNNHIKHILNIDHKLRVVDFFETNSEVTLKVCNLLSIFIDNAIDEVNLQTNKLINIDIYLDDDNTVVFEIINKYISDFNIEKISEKKYTTKSKGHGYGLALAKEIIDCEPRIKNITTSNNGLFTQILSINTANKNDKN